jgi:SAM-dependent methyltransferase
MAVDEAKLEEFMGQFVQDMGAAASGALVAIGDQLGLYRGLAEGGPATAAELAQRTGTHERYVREWLLNQGAGGYVSWDPAAERWFLTEEQQFALVDEGSPAYVLGAFEVLQAMYADAPKIAERFRTGAGLDWGDHDHRLFGGTARFFAPGYRANLVAEWIPALDGVEAKLRAGARVADVGCGHGISTVLLAQAYPDSQLFGFDYHAPSIEQARRGAAAAGVENVSFEVAGADAFPGEGYDLVAHFDCLHDLGDPVGAGRRVRETLAPDGTWMIIEPMAGDAVEDNLNPVGRIFAAASTVVCVPTSLAQDGIALGAQAGEARLREVIEAAGFSRVRRATETPFNLVLEARP